MVEFRPILGVLSEEGYDHVIGEGPFAALLAGFLGGDQPSLLHRLQDLLVVGVDVGRADALFLHAQKVTSSGQMQPRRL